MKLIAKRLTLGLLLFLGIVANSRGQSPLDFTVKYKVDPNCVSTAAMFHLSLKSSSTEYTDYVWSSAQPAIARLADTGGPQALLSLDFFRGSLLESVEITLTASNENGSASITKTVPLGLHFAPVSEFSPRQIASGCAPYNLELESRSQAWSLDDELTYFWDFGDGTHSELKHPNHTYKEPGNYTVRLTTTDAQGCACGSEPEATVLEVEVLPAKSCR